MNELEKAILIASETHAGQRDKAGEAYILHPLRLMLKFTNNEERIVAVLHDVVEDGNITLKDLKKSGFSDSILNAIECLTKRDNEPYSEFIQRVISNKLATKVKIEDIKDNMDLTRLSSIYEKDLERISKYLTEYRSFSTQNVLNTKLNIVDFSHNRPSVSEVL